MATEGGKVIKDPDFQFDPTGTQVRLQEAVEPSGFLPCEIHHSMAWWKL